MVKRLKGNRLSKSRHRGGTVRGCGSANQRVQRQVRTRLSTLGDTLTVEAYSFGRDQTCAMLLGLACGNTFMDTNDHSMPGTL